MLRSVAASETVFAKANVPFVWAPTGTMANNGAITLGTALETTYASCYLLLPAGAIAAGVPAASTWYFAQMSSASAGTVFNNPYTSGQPTIPASPTAFATTGPGAYTGVTGAVTGPNFSMPGGTLGLNGVLRYSAVGAVNNSANNKTVNGILGSTAILSGVFTTVGGYSFQGSVYNQGSQSVQSAHSPVLLGGTAGSGSFFTINTGAAQTVGIQGNLATATDYITLDGFMLEAMP